MSDHYHVLVGLRGCYMPDSNDVCRTLQDAFSAASWQIEGERDAGHKVQGSKRDRFWVVRDPAGIPQGRGSYGWRAIEITECNEPECLCPDLDCDGVMHDGSIGCVDCGKDHALRLCRFLRSKGRGAQRRDR